MGKQRGGGSGVASLVASLVASVSLVFCLAALALAAGCAGDEAAEGTPPGEAEILVRREPADRAACPRGGTILYIGPDLDGDGVLDNDEIRHSEVSCEARPTLVRLVEEPAGARCPRGGTAIHSGPDTNGNQRLDDDEIDLVEYVCDARLLTRATAFEPNRVCAAGGVLFQAGRDRDDDAVLDDDEIEQSESRCNAALDGSAVIRNASDVATLAGVTTIRGDLQIALEPGVTLGEVELPALTSLTGSLLVEQQPLTALRLPALRSIGGDAIFREAAPLTTVALPELTSITGALRFDDNAALTSVTMPKLLEVGSDFAVIRNAALRSVPTPADRVGGKTLVHDNPLLSLFNLDLDYPTTTAEVLRNATLYSVTLSFPSADIVQIADNATLTSATVAEGGPAERRASLGAVTISGNPKLNKATVTAARIGSLDISGNEAIRDIDITADSIADQLVLDNGDGSLTQYLTTLPRDAAKTFTIGGDLTLVGKLFQWSTGQGRQLVVGGDFRMKWTFLSTLSQLASVGGSFTLARNGHLATVDDLQSVGGSITFDEMPNLVRFATLSQPTLHGSLTIRGCRDLRDLSFFTNLRQIDGNVVFSNNFYLPRIQWGLERVLGSILIEQNFFLSEVRWDNLLSAGDLTVADNLDLASLTLPALISAGHFTLRTTFETSALPLPALTSLLSFTAIENYGVPTCQLAALCTRLGLSGDACHLESNDDEATCEAP